jgi:Translation machinery-associated protein 16
MVRSRGSLTAFQAQTNDTTVHRIAFFQAALRELEAGRGVGEIAVITNGNEKENEDDKTDEHTEMEDALPSEDSRATDLPDSHSDPRFSTTAIQSVITTYISSLSSLHPSNKSYSASPDLTFKPFRPAARTAAESKALEKQKMATREYASGFWCPDLRREKVREYLNEWRGDWAGLNTLMFVRVDATGNVKDSSFPPRGGV